MDNEYDFTAYYNDSLNFSVNLKLGKEPKKVLQNDIVNLEMENWIKVFEKFENISNLELPYIIKQLVINGLPHFSNINVDELSNIIYKNIFEDKLIGFDYIVNTLIDVNSYIQFVSDITFKELISSQYVFYIRDLIYQIILSDTYNTFKNAKDFKDLSSIEKDKLKKILDNDNIENVIDETNTCIDKVGYICETNTNTFEKLEEIYNKLYEIFYERI